MRSFINKYISKVFIGDLFLIAIGAFILQIVGFYNNYPLVYSDTGTYLYSGFDGFVPNDRPLTYGLFVWITSFRVSLWFVITVQNIVSSFLIYQVFKLFVDRKDERFSFYFLAVMLGLTFLTGIGWYSNQIMPDFATPLMILAIALIVFSPKLSPVKWLLYSAMIIYLGMMHLSHLFISFGLIVAYFVVERILVKTKIVSTITLSWTKLFAIVTLCVISWLSLAELHYRYGGGFRVSKSSNFFFAAHLVDNGLMERYLSDKCRFDDMKSCKLCQSKDSLPNNLSDFLFSQKSPLMGYGNLEDVDKQYGVIIKKMLSNPEYLALNLHKTFAFGFSQLFRTEIGQGLSAYNEGSPPYQQIHWRFRGELNNYLNSRQNRWNGAELKLGTLNLFHSILLMISLLGLLYIAFYKQYYKKLDNRLLLFLTFCVIAIVINAFLTAGLNSPCERFQAKVVWLLPFCLSLLLITSKNSNAS